MSEYKHNIDKRTHSNIFFVGENGELIKEDDLHSSSVRFRAIERCYSDHGQEFLVVDHPRVISREEYEKTKSLYSEEVEEVSSYNGVF